MTETALSMLRILAGSGFLLGLYLLLLDRRVAFRWCRAYLLGSMLFAAAAPLVRIPVWPGEVIRIQEASPQPASPAPEALPRTAPDTIPLTTIAYLLGVAALSGTIGRQLVRIRRLRAGARITRHPDFLLVRTPQPIAPFSFGRSVYVWDQTPEQELQPILLHEASHIAHRHTLERSLMEGLKILLWWNPCVWIAARKLTEIEEFEADHDVLTSGYDRNLYMQAILKQLLGYTPGIASGLKHSLIKKRFRMMTAPTASGKSRMRLAATLPAFVALLYAFSFTARAPQVEIIPARESEPAEESVPADNDTDAPFLTADQMPRFRNGTLNDFTQWLMSQLRYPEATMQQQKQGRVVVSFVIERNGSVNDIRVIKSAHPMLTQEVIRVLSISPKWTPGQQQGKPVRIRYILPVDFIIQDDRPPQSKQAPDPTPDSPSASRPTMMDEIVVISYQ